MKKIFLMSAAVCALCAAGPLPDAKLTPGATRGLTQAQICATKWGKDERAVTQVMKMQAYKAYGFSGPRDARCPCEVDHLISRELGGADEQANLWPQPYSGPWNAHMKDRVENKLHVEVCSGRLGLADAQAQIAEDWTKAWTHYFGVAMP